MQPSQYRVAGISPHLTTNAWVIEQFGVARVNINASEKAVAIAPLPQPKF
ncbi:hypothetical protein [Chroogloeocystis siderophila]|jgi:RNA 3'-terminal phosphate cyclase (ATP)|nr:hypothetical protein [Chroogloeocystis siderophila]